MTASVVPAQRRLNTRRPSADFAAHGILLPLVPPALLPRQALVRANESRSAPAGVARVPPRPCSLSQPSAPLRAERGGYWRLGLRESKPEGSDEMPCAKVLPALSERIFPDNPLEAGQARPLSIDCPPGGRGGEATAHRAGPQGAGLPALRRPNQPRRGLRLRALVGRHLLRPGVPGGLPRGLLS